jgi:hypothetical protein
MKKILLLLFVMFSIVCILNDTSIENMVNFGDYNILAFNDNDDSYKTNNKIEISNKKVNLKTDQKCCLVEKKYIPNGTHYGGEFIYKFNKLKNEECELNHFRLDSNKQLFFDKSNSKAIDIPNNSQIEWANNWSNENCDPAKNILGSCRNSANICIDFVDKKNCDKYKMIWSNKTCNDKIDYDFDNKKQYYNISSTPTNNNVDSYNLNNMNSNYQKTFRMF